MDVTTLIPLSAYPALVGGLHLETA